MKSISSLFSYRFPSDENPARLVHLMVYDDPVREINVLIADDDVFARQALSFFVNTADDMTVVGEASDGPAAVQCCRDLRPDVALMDIRMPGGDGVTAIARIAEQMPLVRTIAITTCCSEETVLAALRAGAAGFLAKEAAPEQVVAAIHSAHRGGKVLSPGAAQNLLHAIDESKAAPLTSVTPLRDDEMPSPREQTVIELLAQGMSNSEIARELFLSESTVKSHLRRIMTKWDVRDRVQVLVHASKAGLVDIL